MKNKSLTLAAVSAALSPYCITIAKRDGEYLLRVKGSPAGHGYFTNDLCDALEAGLTMTKAVDLSTPALRAAYAAKVPGYDVSILAAVDAHAALVGRSGPMPSALSSPYGHNHS